MPAIILKPGREKSILRRHPWIFSGAVHRVDGSPTAGCTVDVISSSGDLLARASYSPSSQIRARIWTFDPSESVDADFISQRISRAIRARNSLPPTQDGNDSTIAMRIIHAESDGFPGLIVDRYAHVAVIQLLSAGAEFWRDTIVDSLTTVDGIRVVYERSDADVRALEGLPSRVGTALGNLEQSLLTIIENGLSFYVDISAGHKTGFYLDQRINRQKVREISSGREVLDCFCYTGGFTLNALAGGAKSVLSVDASSEALNLCQANLALNNLPSGRQSILEGDVFQVLRKFRDEGRSFDLVILDPPKFAPTIGQVEKASRGYKDINLLGFKLLRPGGILVTFSCSGGIDTSLFQKIVASAALDAGVDAQILSHLDQAPDHPIALNFPEGAYLKGLVCLKE